MSIITFNQPEATTVSIAGGKGASLAVLTQAGFPVPEGFIIPATAYEAFLHHHSLKEDIDAQFKKINVDDMNSIERASVVIQDSIHDSPLPQELEQQFRKAFDRLDAHYVAVRSSATAEDSQVASWAGELETYLYTTQETYLSMIKKCWASLFSPRALFYRYENKLEDAVVHVAVVVQKMVNSDVAGVCFSVHPVTQDRNQMIIEACWGLGEALVSGRVTPDSYIVTKKPLEIVDTFISEQKEKIIQGPKGGTVIVSLSTKEGSKQKLSKESIFDVAQHAMKIEQHYGFPIDMEWAQEKGKVFITQARPITTLRK